MLFIGYSNHLYASALPYELFYCHIYIKVLIWLQNTYSSTMQCTYVLVHVCIWNTFLSTYILQIGKLFGSKWSWCRYLGIYVFLTKCITQELLESSNKGSYTTYILYLPTICTYLYLRYMHPKAMYVRKAISWKVGQPPLWNDTLGYISSNRLT